MDYECKKCIVCGSQEIKMQSRQEKDGNVFFSYNCKSCDCVFSSESAFKDKQECTLNKSNGEMSAKDIYKKNIGGIIEIVSGFDDNLSVGTGMVLESGYILTNAHLIFENNIKDNSLINLSESINGKTYEKKEMFGLELIYADKENDIALLKTEKVLPHLKLSEKTPETGDKIIVIGNSKGEGISILEGIISDNKRIISGQEFLLISAPVTNGNSGGPVFDVSGEVIGMVAKGRKDASAMNYAIPSAILLQFLKTAKEKEDIDI